MKVIHKNTIMKLHEKNQTVEEVAARNMKRMRQLLTEKNVYKLLNQDMSPFIVRMHSAFTSKNYLYMVIDLCPGGDLFNLIQKHKRFSPEEAMLLFAEVVLAVEHLHNHNILYRDLKPENILVDEWGNLKITDFGLAKENFKKDDETQTQCGSPEYYCPEVLREQSYSRTLDFYSLGVLLYEMLTSLPPFYRKRKTEMARDIASSKLPSFDGLSGDSLDLVKKLLEKDPKARLGAVNGI